MTSQTVEKTVLNCGGQSFPRSVLRADSSEKGKINATVLAMF